MNIMIKEQNPEHEYRAALQSAALSYMQRHQAEHLGNDQQLFARTVFHLQASLEVPDYLAETLTGLAYVDLRSSAGQQRLDLRNSSESVVVLFDQISGKSFAIPVELIFQQLFDAFGRRRKVPFN